MLVINKNSDYLHLSEDIIEEFRLIQEKFGDPNYQKYLISGGLFSAAKFIYIAKYFEIDSFIKYISIDMHYHRDTEKYDCKLKLLNERVEEEYVFELASKYSGNTSWKDNIIEFVSPNVADINTFIFFMSDKLNH